MLEHLDRHHAVVTGFRQAQIVDVRSDHFDVEDGTFQAARLDELALRLGIGNRGDPGIGELLGHPQGQRAPAAAQLEDALAIAQLGTFRVQPHHVLLGHVEAGGGFVPVTAAVFQVLAQAELEELGGQFMVLAIDCPGLQGDIAVAQALQPGLLALEHRIGAALAFVLQALRALATDAHPEDVVGDTAGFRPASGKALLFGFGGVRGDRCGHTVSGGWTSTLRGKQQEKRGMRRYPTAGVNLHPE